jgi:inhibitor of cysteine peptidase
MPNPELAEFISKSRSAGSGDAEIKKALSQAGWPEESIAEALSAPIGPVLSITKESGQISEQEASKKRKPLKKILAGLAALIVIFGGGYAAYAKFNAVQTLWNSTKATVAEKAVAIWPFGRTPASSQKPSVSATPAVSGESALPSSDSRPQSSSMPAAIAKAGLQQFASEEEFKTYLENGSSSNYGGSFFGAGQSVDSLAVPMTAPSAKGIASGRGAANESAAIAQNVPDRVSETNVQVAGVDEPDIVKTDGKEIYLSRNVLGSPIYRMLPAAEPGISIESKAIAPQPAPQTAGPETAMIKAFPPAEIAKNGSIDKTGNLLVSKNILMILPDTQSYYGYYNGYAKQTNSVYGYDVSDPASPQQLWKLDLKDNTFLSDARLSDGKLYLITRTSIDRGHPCPIVPVIMGSNPLSIPCANIYHPIGNVPADTTITAMAVNPGDGKIEKNISILASNYSSVTYMSPANLYLTYDLPADFVGIYAGFFAEKGQDLVSAGTLERLRKLQSYELSDQAKMTELGVILEREFASADNDKRLQLENELSNRAKDYFTEHAREMEKTAITKIDLAAFSVAASGDVPGKPLNQFSLDEYKNNLRVAVTVSAQGMMWGFGSSTPSVNDVYVLDEKLSALGSIRDLGLTERIYSARFVNDRGYIVTFRQTDPFYVLDLSNPSNPQRKGELKIPGYSSYLHPIDTDIVLGVGMENSQVKLSLFDVSDPANPAEKAKYNLSEYWTDVSKTHHAFLQDAKHQVFFMPGSRGSYIFSYAGNGLKNVATLAGVNADRAIYLDDYLYVIASDKITVFNENDWQKVNQIEL